MEQIFIQTVAVDSGRWRQAFPEAQIFSAERAKSYSFKATDTVWIIAAGDFWPVLQAACAAGNQVLALTLQESPAEARLLLAAGARGYVHALAVPEVLQQAQQVVANGGLWLGRSLMADLLRDQAPPQKHHPHLQLLTARERAVALAVASGLSNKEVARELAITERTVKAHLSACFEKLQVRDRMQLALALKH